MYEEYSMIYEKYKNFTLITYEIQYSIIKLFTFDGICQKTVLLEPNYF